MALIGQSIDTLFGGISQQPDKVKQANQVEDAINVVPSIVSGGLSKRAPTILIDRMRTIENLVEQSEDMIPAAPPWPWQQDAVDAVVSEVSDDYPFLDDITPVFEIETATGADPDTGIYQDIPDVDGEVVLSIYHYHAPAAPDGAFRLVVDDPDLAPFPPGTPGLAWIEIDDAGAIIGEAGTLDYGQEDLGGGWFRSWFQCPGFLPILSFRIAVLADPVGVETAIVTRPQFEHVDYVDQVGPIEYGMTEDFRFPRTATPGEPPEALEFFTHPIDRDANEQNMLCVTPSNLHVYDTFTGAPIQVIVGRMRRYFCVDFPLDALNEWVFPIRPAEYEVLLDRMVEWKDWGGPDAEVTVEFGVTETGPWEHATVTAIATDAGNASPGATAARDGAGDLYQYIRIRVTTAGGAGSIFSVSVNFRDIGYFTEGWPYPEELNAVSIADYTFINNSLVTVELMPYGHPDWPHSVPTILGYYQRVNPPGGSNLPVAEAGNVNQLAKIQGDDYDNFKPYWLVCRAQHGGHAWIETVDPGLQNQLGGWSMPHRLVRQTTGRYTYNQADWTPRQSGDNDTNPRPAFVDNTINFLTFFRGRMCALSDENVILSRVDDVFSWFAEKAMEVLDTDPIDRSSGTADINVFNFGVPFRKILVASSQRRQFEFHSGDSNLTPRTAVIEPSTSYGASGFCRPTLMGDTLYFPSTSGLHDIIYEYIHNADLLTNTASDITKHVGKLIPKYVRYLASDATSGTLFAITSDTDNTNKIYVYKVFWDNQQKVMSSWVKYELPNCEYVHSITVFGGYLLIVASRGGQVFMEEMEIEDASEVHDMPFLPRADMLVHIQGTYNAADDHTYWELPYDVQENAAGDAITVAMLGADFPDGPGGNLIYEYTGNVVRYEGDWTLGPVFFGTMYNSLFVFSNIHYRDQQGTSVLAGKLQVKDVDVHHFETSYYEVHVTPEYKPTREYVFSGVIPDCGGSFVGRIPQMSGKFRVPILANNEKVSIEVSSSAPLPFTIVTYSWRGLAAPLVKV